MAPQELREILKLLMNDVPVKQIAHIVNRSRTHVINQRQRYLKVILVLREDYKNLLDDELDN